MNLVLMLEDGEQPLPWTVEAVLTWRGVLNENTAGAGI